MIYLCLSGQPRYIKECKEPLINNLLFPNNITSVFTHFWWDDSYIGKIFKTHALDVYENNPIDQVSELFDNIYGKFEPQKDFDISLHNLNNGDQSVELDPKNKEFWCREVLYKQYSMWFSAKQAFNCINTYSKPIDEDIVVRSRTDIIYEKPIQILESKIEKRTIYLGEDDGATLCDWFAIGRLDTIKIYHDIYDNIGPLSNFSCTKSTTLLKKHLENNDIKISKTIPGIKIFRGYKKPYHMNNYSESNKEVLPYWMK